MSVHISTGKPSLAPIIPNSQNKLSAAGMTFTRTGNATRVNSDRLIENVSANLPRFDYDPTPGGAATLRGLLIEEARSNLCLYSGRIGLEGSPTIWGTAASATVAASASTAPDGTLNATQVTCGTSTSRVTQIVSGLTPGQVYAASCFFAPGTITAVALRMVNGAIDISRADVDMSTILGSVTLADVTSPGIGVRATLERFFAGSTSWYRVSLVFVATATSMTFQLITSGATGTFHAWGAQLEACGGGGYNSTSYIPTTSAAVSRGADTLTVTLDDKLTDSGTGFLAGGGAIVVEFQKTKLDTNQAHIIWAAKDSSTDFVKLSLETSALIKVKSGSGSAGTATYTADAVTKVAAKWTGAGSSVSVAGAAAESQAGVGAGVDAMTLQIGFYDVDASYLNGHIRSLAIYDNPFVIGLSNADLATLSGGGEIDADPVFEFDVTETDLAEQIGGRNGAGEADLDFPMIAYHDVGRDGTVSASSEQSAYPADAAQRYNTYERWQPASMPSAVATWQNDLGANALFNYCMVVGHNLGTKMCSVKVRYSGDGGNYLDASDEFEPEDDSDILILFSTAFGRYPQLYIESQASPNDTPTIAHIRFGLILTAEQRIYGGHTPVDLARQTEVLPAVSKGGNFLGNNIQSSGFKTNVALRYMTPEWVRENFKPFMLDARRYPYGFAWRPEAYPDGFAYVWTEGDIKPSNMGQADFMQASWPVAGYDGLQ